MNPTKDHKITIYTQQKERHFDERRCVVQTLQHTIYINIFKKNFSGLKFSL